MRGSSVLRSAAALQEGVFELCGLETRLGLGVDERQVKIECFDRTRKEAFERLLTVGKVRFET
jgi:hypothetical protein